MRVEIVPHDPSWKKRYTDEASIITSVCGDLILTIEHGGSTAIEGIAAKPVVDIYIGVKNQNDAESLIKKLELIGYEYTNAFADQEPFHKYFRKETDGMRLFQIHVLLASDPFKRDDMLFKDYIAIKPDLLKQYESLKCELGEKFWYSSIEYCEAKTEFIISVKNEALKFFSKLYEETESEVTYLMHCYTSEEARKKAKFHLLHENGITAIRTDIFPGFSLNRALGFSEINENILDRMEEFFKGRVGKFALQIQPFLLDDKKIKLLTSRGYSYSSSWVTFCRDSSPVHSRGTDLEIREIGKEYAGQFAFILNEVFGFPHEFDDIAASAVGSKEWVIFMAYDGDKPVGSAGICITGETAYLSFANILPEYRRRGAQGELLARRIDAARKRGVKWIVVDTAESSDEHPNPSYWNMLRHGFRLLYHRPNFVKVQ